jgi:hypothetical protein
MDARTKAVKTHRKRLRTRGLKRVEVTVRADDAALMRRLAADLRRSDANAERLRTSLQAAFADRRRTTLAESLYDPTIAGPEFDEVFEEIEQFRHDPAMAKARSIDL